MKRTKLDIDCEELDFYFAKNAKNLSTDQRAQLPKDLANTLYKQGGDIRPSALSRIGFIAKLLVLWKFANKRFFIAIEDENEGITVGQFSEIQKAWKKRNVGIDKVNSLFPKGSFMLVDKELSNMFAYLNLACTSKAYNYINHTKNLLPNRALQWETEMTAISNFISRYESNRKKMILSSGIDVAQWLVLLYYYHGEALPSSPVWKDYYRYSYNSSSTKVKVAFKTLQQSGYLEKIGNTKTTQFKITALGKEKVDQMMSKFVING